MGARTTARAVLVVLLITLAFVASEPALAASVRTTHRVSADGHGASVVAAATAKAGGAAATLSIAASV